MPRAPRLQFEDAYYHAYNRGVEKRTIVLDDRDRRTFLRLLADTVRVYRLRLFAYCLMDNHFHLFLNTPDANVDAALQYLQGQHAHFINLRYDRVGPLFQGRYKAKLVEVDRYAWALTRYIHRNPLVAGSCQRLEEYAWSSYGCYVGERPTWEWLNTQWMLQQFHKEPATARLLFTKFHHERSADQDRRMIERRGRTLGNPKIPSRAKGV